METNQHFTSRMLTCAGVLMMVSAILMLLCAKQAYGGILFAAAAGMFFASNSFRVAEDQKELEENENE